MKLKYVGPHDGVDIEDAVTGFRGSAEQGGEVTPEPPKDVAARLVEQGDYEPADSSSPKARKDEE
jgi:hypothetical protein